MLRVLAFFMAVFLALPLRAEAVAPIDRLIDALALHDILGIMREEGMGYGQQLRDEMFPGRGGVDWDNTVARIYEPDRMHEVMRSGLSAELVGADLDPLITFFTSPVGQRVVQLEVTARRAMLDDTIEEASRQALYDLRENDTGRLGQLDRFVTANDLVEWNVMGALNSNFAFYLGLVEGGAFPFEITEEQILADIWDQEPEIRLETEEWLYSYLLMAYDPLVDGDLEAYIALSLSPEGQALNRALFEAFDTLFWVVSRELGQGAATQMAGEDI